MPYMEKKIMSHFLSILCGLGSVLTEVGVISKSYLCCAAWERRQQATERDKYIFTAGERSGNNYYFKSNYYKVLASVCKQTIGTEPHIYFILSSLSI